MISAQIQYSATSITSRPVDNKLRRKTHPCCHIIILTSNVTPTYQFRCLAQNGSWHNNVKHPLHYYYYLLLKRIFLLYYLNTCFFRYRWLHFHKYLCIRGGTQDNKTGTFKVNPSLNQNLIILCINRYPFMLHISRKVPNICNEMETIIIPPFFHLKMKNTV